MARVTYGAMITELAGSIGGMTFQKNPSGNIARAKPQQPVNPSLSQNNQITLVTTLNSLWSTLSSADQDSWSAFALAHNHTTPWGSVKVLNGFQWFMSCNLNLLVTVQATIQTAPAWTAVASVQQFTISATQDNFRLVFVPNFDFTGYRYIVYATPPVRKTTIKLRSNNYIVTYADAGSIGFIEIINTYGALFNIDFNDLIVSSECVIILRIRQVQEGTGLSSPFTSGILRLTP